MVKFFLCKHEDLSSAPCKKLGLVVHACNLSAGHIETGGFLGPELQVAVSWERDLGPLEGHQVLLAAELSLQPQTLLIFFFLFWPLF